MGTDHRKPVDFAQLLGSEITLFFLSIPAFIPRSAKAIILAALGWYFYRVILTQTTGSFFGDNALGATIFSYYMLTLDLAFLTPPEISRGFHDKDPTPVSQRSFKKRLIFALKLFSNPRCIGWAHEPSHLLYLPSLSTSRSRFVFSRIFLATCFVLISRGTSAFHAAYYANTTKSDNMVTGAPFLWRAVLVLSFGLGSACALSGIQVIISGCMVGCGLSSPERWPLLFGSPLQAWSIKRFWRRFWHQMIRGYVLSYTSFFLERFFPTKYVGTTSHKLARLYIVFFISAIMHLSADVMATGKLGFKSFTFFMLQPFGITIEIVVSHLWHRLQRDRSNRHKTTVNAARQNNHNGNVASNNNGKPLPEEPIPPMWVRCVGFIWVTLWMVWTAAYMLDVSLSGFQTAKVAQI